VIYVYRNGRIVPKSDVGQTGRNHLALPNVSRMEPYASPIDGKTISSWRQRDADMKANDAYDPRDRGQTYEKGRASKGQEDNGKSGFEWR
jgi:hypothetical protein